MKFHKGRYELRYPKKYAGDSKNVVYRSSWELQCMVYFDRNPDIVKWASEELIIPYKSPLDSKVHRYFPDFIIQTSKGKTIVIEVKPFRQTKKPKVRKNKSKHNKQYLYEVRTWGVNEAKWKAAEQYCKKKGWEFQILTEKDIYKKRPK